MRTGISKDIRNNKSAKDSYYEKETLHIDSSPLQALKKSGGIYYISR